MWAVHIERGQPVGPSYLNCCDNHLKHAYTHYCTLKGCVCELGLGGGGGWVDGWVEVE